MSSIYYCNIFCFIIHLNIYFVFERCAPCHTLSWRMRLSPALYITRTYPLKYYRKLLTRVFLHLERKVILYSFLSFYVLIIVTFCHSFVGYATPLKYRRLRSDSCCKTGGVLGARTFPWTNICIQGRGVAVSGKCIRVFLGEGIHTEDDNHSWSYIRGYWECCYSWSAWQSKR